MLFSSLPLLWRLLQDTVAGPGRDQRGALWCWLLGMLTFAIAMVLLNADTSVRIGNGNTTASASQEGRESRVRDDGS